MDAGEIGGLLAGLEAPVPSPAGGTAAAVTGAMAASLLVMVGRGSTEWPDGAAVAARAAVLRDRLLQLGDDDVKAFADVLTHFRRLRTEPHAREAVAAALLRASDVPLEIAQSAAEVADLGSRAAAEGKRPMRPDAATAALLAGAAARAASLIVDGNVATLRDGPQADRVARLLDDARNTRQQASDAVAAATAATAPSS